MARANLLRVAILATFFALLLALCGYRIARAQDTDGVINFTWSPNTETNLAGYRLYQGTTAGGPYGMVAQILVTSNDHPTTHTLRGLSDGTYFWVLTAFNTPGLESGFSNEVSQTVLLPLPPDPPSDFTIVAALAVQIKNGSVHLVKLLRAEVVP